MFKNMIFSIKSIVPFAIACVLSTSAFAANITVSIPPLAGIIAPILDKSDTLNVLLKNGQSPHGFQLKPSNLVTLASSELIVLVGTPVDAWAKNTVVAKNYAFIAMNRLPGAKILPRREKVWQKVTQNNSEAEQHSQHQHENHDHHEHEHDHNEAQYDGHVWLAIQNAKALVQAVSEKLQTQYPEQSQQYAQRTERWLEQLSQLQQENQQRLATVTNKRFLVLHDAYQYFEVENHLNGLGAVRLNPEISASPKHLIALQHLIVENQVQCIFKEPQFPEKTIRLLASKNALNIGSLNPMGRTDSEQDYQPYDAQLRDMTDSFVQCLVNH